MRFLPPGGGVVVAVENDALVVGDGIHHDLLHGGADIYGGFELIGELAQHVGHNGVDDHVGFGDGLRRAGTAELKFISCESEGRRAVAVGGVLGDARQGVDADVHFQLFPGGVGVVVLDGVQHGFQLVTQEHGDDGGRRFVAAQAVVVARAGDGDAQQILMQIDRFDDRHQEQQELGVLGGRLPRLQQVQARVGAQGPVVVLARAVHPSEGLFMQQTGKPMLCRHPLHDFHGELVVVGGQVGGGEHGSQLMLARRGLVVFRLGGHAQLPQLLIHLLHERLYPGLQVAKVMVIQFLALGRTRAEQSAAGIDQILALVIQIPVDEEIFLLRPNCRRDLFHVDVSQQPQHALGLPVDRLAGAQQRRFLIQRVAAVAAKRGGNAQGAVLDKGVAGGVPGGVAPGLEGRPQSARGEGRSVRLATHQLLAAKLHDGPAAVDGRQKGIMLFRGDTRHGLEPVGVMGGPFFYRPVLHGVRHHAGDLQVQALALGDGTVEGFIGLLGQALTHDRVVEYQASEGFL